MPRRTRSCGRNRSGRRGRCTPERRAALRSSQLDRNRRFNARNSIHHNLLHDSGGYSRRAAETFTFPSYSWGIYLDLHCSQWRVHDNVVWNTVLGGFMLNCGQNNVVENNIFVGGRETQIYFNPWPKYSISGNRCERNIVVYDGGAASLYTFNRLTNEAVRFAGNLIHCRSGVPRVAGLPRVETMDQREPRSRTRQSVATVWRRQLQGNWEQWLAMGQDQGSLLADPQFFDAGKHDFRLKPGSPALKLGFKPIDLSSVGNYPSPDRRIWPRPEVAVAREPADYHPAAALPPQQPALRDYESYGIGEPERGAHVGIEAGLSSVAVTEETAAGGKRSLKFTDAAGQKASYAPFVTYPLEVDEGIVRAGFDLRLEEGAQFVYEWRDDPYQYNLGPRLAVDAQGWLSANGKRLVQLPHGQWVRFDLACGLGDKATGKYDLILRLPGGQPRQFRDVACAPKFKTLNCVVIMSLANGPSVFYLDNLEFKVQSAGR